MAKDSKRLTRAYRHELYIILSIIQSPQNISQCSGSNYQNICNTNGVGYKCLISGSGELGGILVSFMCDKPSFSQYCLTGNYHDREEDTPDVIDWDTFMEIDIERGSQQAIYNVNKR